MGGRTSFERALRTRPLPSHALEADVQNQEQSPTSTRSAGHLRVRQPNGDHSAGTAEEAFSSSGPSDEATPALDLVSGTGPSEDPRQVPSKSAPGTTNSSVLDKSRKRPTLPGHSQIITLSRSKAASANAVTGIAERIVVEDQVRTARAEGEVNGVSKLLVHRKLHILSLDDTPSLVACPQSSASSPEMATQRSPLSRPCVRTSPPFMQPPLGPLKHPAPEMHDENIAGCGACDKSIGGSASPKDRATPVAAANTACGVANSEDQHNGETESNGAGNSINPTYSAAYNDGEEEEQAALKERKCQLISQIAPRDSFKDDTSGGDDTSTPTASSGSEPSLAAASAEMEPANMEEGVELGIPALVGAKTNVEEAGLDGRALEPCALSNLRTPEMAISLEEGCRCRSLGDTGGAQAQTQSPKQTESLAALDQLGPRVVLPCAPSDEEKVMYYKSNRFYIITAASVSFLTLSVAMALFTLSSPYFYWFGVPTVFLTLYIASSFFVVAMWGRDFEPETHSDVVERASAEVYRPSVDVFLPVCGEPLGLLANTWDHIASLDYENLVVHVLDDGGQDDVRRLAAKYGFEYIQRPNRPELKKAGNIRYAFSRTSCDLIAIFDADFCPRVDFLRETVPYFVDPAVGILQTPQFFRWRKEQTWVEQGAGVTQELFFRMVQTNHQRFNASTCVGSCGVYRRAALEPLGGMAAISHSEDVHTGFRITDFGFQVKYIPLVLSMGICPNQPRTFFMQQYRWCMGTLSLVLGKDFWTSKVTLMQKICFVNGMLYYMTTALMLFLGPMPVALLVWIHPRKVVWVHVGFVLPSIIYAVALVPLWAKQRYFMSCYRVKIIQCYAHLYAVKDYLMGTAAPWVPSGWKSSMSSSKSYRSSVWLLLVWNTLITAAIVGGSCWRMSELVWYDFLPIVVLTIWSLLLNMSTLWF